MGAPDGAQGVGASAGTAPAVAPPPLQPQGQWQACPPGRRRPLLLTGGALLLLSAVAVAVAVPVSQQQREQHQAASNDGSSPPQHARELNAAASGGANAAVPAAKAASSGVPGAQESSSRGAAAIGSASSSAAPAQTVPTSAPACNGVPGLCSVPVRFVSFPGTHNSNAVKNRELIGESQKLGFKEQLAAGARMFDLDYAGTQQARFGHCLGCFCSFASNSADAKPAEVFATMASFLSANPREVIVLGMSNINCGDKDAARKQVLGVLAASPLAAFLATKVVGPSTTLGELVESNQRAVLLFYDEWTTPTGYTVGSKAIPNQPLFRIYGRGASVDASDAAAIDKQTAQQLLQDIGKQFAANAPSRDMPWRIVGLFVSSCMTCRGALQCGAISCAPKPNYEPFVAFLVGRLTADWLAGSAGQLMPAFNGFQVDYLSASSAERGLVAAATRSNKGFAWMYTFKAKDAPQVGLGNCVWVLDGAAYAGGLACVHHGQVHVPKMLGLAPSNATTTAAGRRLLQDTGASASRQLLLPANSKLQARLYVGTQLKRQAEGSAQKIQVLDMGADVDGLQVLWV